MIEENFIRLYARDFVQLSIRAELGQDVDDALERKVAEARVHSGVMDARKGSDHLAALRVRLREEAVRFNDRGILKDVDPAMAAGRRLSFLNRIADRLDEPGDGVRGKVANSLSLAPYDMRQRRSRPPGA